MTIFPGGFGAQITGASALDPDDSILGNIDGGKANIATKALRGCTYTAASTGAAYTATRTTFNEDFYLTVNANTVITLAGGGVTGEISVWNIVFVQDATGGRTITVLGVTWFGGTPTFTTTAQTANSCSFVQHGTGPIFGYYGGAASGATVYTSDTFTRADGNLSGSTPETTTGGATWLTINGAGGTGVFSVATNKAKKTTAGGAFESVCLVGSGVSDCTISSDITYVTGTNAGVAFRGLDTANFNLALMSGGDLFFYTVVAGSYVSVSTSAALFVNAATYAIKVVLLGTSVKIYVDNVLKIDTTSSANQTRLLHGLRAYNDSVTIFDNFLVTS